jgi:SAM-dependent methyltransferase
LWMAWTDNAAMHGPADQYMDGTHQCWYLERPSDELRDAVVSGWLRRPGRVVDLGCGLGTELRYLAERGWECLGVDLSLTALASARMSVSTSHFVSADVRRLPVPDGWATALIDRGCFHYLQPDQRAIYAAEACRVLRPDGRLLLRACLPHQPEPGGINEGTVRDAFGAWNIVSLRRRTIPVEQGSLHAIEARLERP